MKTDKFLIMSNIILLMALLLCIRTMADQKRKISSLTIQLVDKKSIISYYEFSQKQKWEKFIKKEQ